MAKGIQGHTIDLNLSELDNRSKDSISIDNIAGQGLSNDISLFSNNLKNKSVIPSSKYSVMYVTIGGVSQPVIQLNDPFMIPFSNNTIVYVNTIQCKIENSNVVNRFQLRNIVSNVLVDPVDADIIRFDTLTTKNFAKINPTRIATVSGSQGIRENADNQLESIYDINIPVYIDEINARIDNYLYIKNGTILLYNDNNFENKLTLQDSVLVSNLDSNGNPITIQNSLSNADPGVFIYNNGEIFRSFSDNTNPWNVETANYTTTNSTNTKIAELELTNPRITGITVSSLIGSIPTAQSTFNESTNNIYFLPVTINGELYNLFTIRQ